MKTKRDMVFLLTNLWIMATWFKTDAPFWVFALVAFGYFILSISLRNRSD